MPASIMSAGDQRLAIATCAGLGPDYVLTPADVWKPLEVQSSEQHSADTQHSLNSSLLTRIEGLCLGGGGANVP